MTALIYSIFVVICIALIVVVLLQSGKGAGLGAAFGGASQTVFGSAGRANFLTKMTGVLAAIFMLLSVFLAWNSSRTYSGGLMENYEEAKPETEMPAGAIPIPSTAEPTTIPIPSEGVEAAQPGDMEIQTEAAGQEEQTQTQEETQTPVTPTMPAPSE